MNLTSFLTGLLTLICLSACVYNNEEALYPCDPSTGDCGGNPALVGCDTLEVSYTAYIAPLLEENCLTCHRGPAAPGVIRLDSYLRVKSFARNGRLYGAISHAPGFPQMPQGGKLPDCDIAKVKSWIEAGAEEN